MLFSFANDLAVSAYSLQAAAQYRAIVPVATESNMVKLKALARNSIAYARTARLNAMECGELPTIP